MAVKDTFFWKNSCCWAVLHNKFKPSHNNYSSRINGVRLEATVWRCQRKVLVKKPLGWLEELVGWKFDVRFNWTKPTKMVGISPSNDQRKGSLMDASSLVGTTWALCKYFTVVVLQLFLTVLTVVSASANVEVTTFDECKDLCERKRFEQIHSSVHEDQINGVLGHGWSMDMY
jgi:hypothetical protein